MDSPTFDRFNSQIMQEFFREEADQAKRSLTIIGDNNQVDVKKYKKPFECGQCSKVLQSFKSLQKHKRNQHIGGKSFQCDLCPKTYTTKFNLDRHLKVHKKQASKVVPVIHVKQKPNTPVCLPEESKALVFDDQTVQQEYVEVLQVSGRTFWRTIQPKQGPSTIPKKPKGSINVPKHLLHLYTKQK